MRLTPEEEAVLAAAKGVADARARRDMGLPTDQTGQEIIDERAVEDQSFRDTKGAIDFQSQRDLGLPVGLSPEEIDAQRVVEDQAYRDAKGAADATARRDSLLDT